MELPTASRNITSSVKEGINDTIGRVKNALTSRTALGAGVTASIITACLTASKVTMFELPLLGDITAPAGFIAFGAAYLGSDILSELHGKEVAHKTVTSAVGALGLSYALVYASVALPAAPFYEQSEAFRTVMMDSTPIIAASIMTTLVSQNLDVALFDKIRQKTNGSRKWARNLGSTLTSQIVDTAMFIGLAFVALPLLFGGEAVPLAVAGSMIVAQYAVKVVVAAIDTPLFYALTVNNE